MTDSKIKPSELEQHTFNNALDILSCTKNIQTLGEYQLNILSKMYIKSYTNDNIIEKQNSFIISSDAYENFTNWLIKNNVDDCLIKYFSLQIFEKYFSELFTCDNSSSIHHMLHNIWRDIQFKEYKDIETIHTASDTALMSLVAYGVENMPCEPKLPFSDVIMSKSNCIKNILKYHHVKSYYSFNFAHNSITDDSNLYLKYGGMGDLFRPVKLAISGDLNEINNLNALQIQTSDNEYFTLHYIVLLYQPFLIYSYHPLHNSL